LSDLVYFFLFRAIDFCKEFGDDDVEDDDEEKKDVDDSDETDIQVFGFKKMAFF
jgi:hypothetical protein